MACFGDTLRYKDRYLYSYKKKEEKQPFSDITFRCGLAESGSGAFAFGQGRRRGGEIQETSYTAGKKKQLQSRIKGRRDVHKQDG